MGRRPLFWQHEGQSVRAAGRVRRCVVEPMEGRLLLAAQATAANVFAQFEGSIPSTRASLTIPINLSASNFTFTGGKSVLGVQVIADDGSGLDPAVIQIKDARNRAVAPIFKDANLASKTQSLAIANFSAGKYKLVVSSKRNSTGAFTVNLFLAGDANGDGQVNAGDLRSVKRNLGKRDTHSGFPTASDANLNGVIDAFDLAQVSANIKDSTRVKVLALSVAPQPAHPLPDGSFAIASSPVTLMGKTSGKLAVSLDRDGDGFDDGTVKADKTGAYSLPATLGEGLNTLRLRVADSLGQQKTATVSVTLDSAPSSIGIAASLPLNGEANDVVMVSGSPQLAYVATGTAGLAIVDTTRAADPVALAQIDLPGDATSLAVDNRLHIAAVATGPAGLQLVDIADPAHPAFLQTIGTDARAVAIVDGIAYVATAVGVESYEVLTAEQLQTLPLEGGVVSLAVEGSTLYTMDSANRLRVIDISEPSMIARGSFTTPQGGGRIFVANQIAYIAASSSISGGFDTVDVSDPDSPLLISASDIDSNNPAGNAAIAVNGSGLAIEVGQLDFASGGDSILDVFDTSDLANTGDSIRRVILPDAPSAVVIASGIAFVADGTAGLQVVNYAPSDDSGNAPTASLESLTPDAQPAIFGLQAVEGTTVHLKATVADDVQVQWIDLLVNGQVVSTATSFPLDLKFDLPKIAPGVSTLTAQIRATDTGGNTALSNLLTFNLIPDTTAPTIVNIDPPATAIRGPSSRSIRVSFSESMDGSTLSAQNIRLLDALNHAQTPIEIQTRRDGRGVQLTYDNLAAGTYRIVLNTTAIKDRAGNPIGGASITSSFTISQGTILWTNPAGGDWADPSNWNLNRVPTASDDVFISTPTVATITHSTGDDTVRSLRAESPFTLSGGTLSITSQGIFDDALTLSGGTLNGAGTVTTNAAVSWSGTVMQGPGITTISTTSTATVPDSALPSLNSRKLNINGILNLGSSLSLSGSAALNNGGTLNFLNDSGLSTSGGAPAFNNSGDINKHGGTSIIAIPFANVGTTSVATGTLSLSSGGSTTGKMIADAGSAIQLNSSTFSINRGASFSGAGTFRISSGVNSLNLSASIPNLVLEGGSITSSTAATLTLAGISNWTAGAITGLTLKIVNGASLAISGSAGKTIGASTVNNAGAITWSGGGALSLTTSTINNTGSFTIQNDLTLSGGATSTFNNAGSLSKSAGSGNSTLALVFNNTGSATAATGNLRFNTGGSATGTFTANTSANITFLTNPYALSGATFTGDGFTHLTNTVLTITISTSVSAANFSFEGGNIDGPGTFTISKTLNWSGGAFLGAGTTRFVSTATVNISGNANKVIESRTVINEGSVFWSGGGQIFARSSVFNNFGAITMQADCSWSNNGGTVPTFNNFGLIKQTAGTTSFAVPFNNSGTLQAQAGAITLSAGGSSSGVFEATNTAAINFSGGTHTLSDGASFVGEGTISISSGAVSVDGADKSLGTLSVTGGTVSFKQAVTFSNFNLAGGSFGAPLLHVSNSMNWSGLSTLDGTAFGSSILTIDPGATLAISGTATKTLNRYNFINQGTAIWSGTGTIQRSDLISTFTNSGTLNIATATGLANLSVNYIQTSSGILKIDIVSASAFDRLNVTGSATLAGNLEISLNGFVPASGTLFQVFSATSITGAFDSIAGGELFTIQSNPNNVTLLAS